MPWPHKNADGKATLGYDEEGKPKIAKAMSNLSSLGETLKDVYLHPIQDYSQYHDPMLEWIGPKGGVHIPPPNVTKQMTIAEKDAFIQKLIGTGLMPKEQALKAMGLNYSADPVLIPATKAMTSYYADLYTNSPKIHETPLTMRIQIRVEVAGSTAGTKNYGIQEILNPCHSYTESEVSRILDKHFDEVKKQLLTQLKEKAK
jgi:hypothetical protein